MAPIARQIWKKKNAGYHKAALQSSAPQKCSRRKKHEPNKITSLHAGFAREKISGAYFTLSVPAAGRNSSDGNFFIYFSLLF